MTDEERFKDLGRRNREGTLTLEEKLELIRLAKESAEKLKAAIREAVEPV